MDDVTASTAPTSTSAAAALLRTVVREMDLLAQRRKAQAKARRTRLGVFAVAVAAVVLGAAQARSRREGDGAGDDSGGWGSGAWGVVAAAGALLLLAWLDPGFAVGGPTSTPFVDVPATRRLVDRAYALVNATTAKTNAAVAEPPPHSPEPYARESRSSPGSPGGRKRLPRNGHNSSASTSATANSTTTAAAITFIPPPGKPLAEKRRDRSRVFPEGKTYAVAGMRINYFQGVSQLDFTADAFAPLSPAQKAAFEQFRIAWSHRERELMDADPPPNFAQLPDDFTKLRFLQSDHYDVAKAVDRLAATLQWRSKPNGIDDFISNPNPLLLARYKHLRVRRIVGLDKLGRPLICERIGEFFGHEEAYRGMPLSSFIMCYAYDLSEISAAMREAAELGVPFSHRVGYIGDLSGMRLTTVLRLIPLLKTLTVEIDHHFVETAGPLLLINAPNYAMRVWSIAKRFLDPHTAANIHILHGPSTSEILSHFGPDVVPVEFGGTNPYTLPHLPAKVDEAFDRAFPLPLNHP